MDKNPLPLFPRGLVYFRQWGTLRWFLLMLLPSLLGACAAYRNGRGAGTAAAIVLLGILFASVLFVKFNSGMASSNWGTFDRRTNPVGYRVSAVVSVLGYLFISLVGYFA